jgi:hypothetical protein
MNVTPHDGSDCITERQTEHGYWWRYEHSDDEPLATLEAAIIVAGDVAAEEALKSGKTYFVARAACGVDAIYVFGIIYYCFLGGSALQPDYRDSAVMGRPQNPDRLGKISGQNKFPGIRGGQTRSSRS